MALVGWRHWVLADRTYFAAIVPLLHRLGWRVSLLPPLLVAALATSPLVPGPDLSLTEEVAEEVEHMTGDISAVRRRGGQGESAGGAGEAQTALLRACDSLGSRCGLPPDCAVRRLPRPSLVRATLSEEGEFSCTASSWCCRAVPLPATPAAISYHRMQTASNKLSIEPAEF